MPHRCIIKFLALNVISNKIISFTNEVLTYWKTSMRLHAEGKIIEQNIQNNNVEYIKETITTVTLR